MVNQFNIHSIKLKSSEAIKRDEHRNFGEALKQYGACMLSLGQLLKEDNLAEELKSNAQTFKQVSQALKICKMCFERVSDIVEKEIPNSSSNNNNNTGGNNLTPSNNNSFVGIGVTGTSNLSTSMINIPSSGFNSSSSSTSFPQVPLNSSFHFSNRSSINSTNSSTSNVASDVNSLRSSMTFNTPPPTNTTPFGTSNAMINNPSAPSLPSSSLHPNNSSPTMSPQLSNSPTIQPSTVRPTSFYGRDSLQSPIQPLATGTLSNRSSVQLSGPTIEFQPPPGAITPRINSPLDSARNRASVSLSDVSTFGVDPSEKRKSIKLGEPLDGESNTDGLDANPWTKLVSSKFVSIYTKERTFKTRDEFFDRELSMTESPEDQWAMIRSHISEITDQVSQHPINNLLIQFTQKFNNEFQKQVDTAWLNVGEANKQIADLATAIVNELAQYWSSLQSMELRHYITKAFAEGVMKRVYRTLVEVYETQNQNKEIEGKLESIGPVTFEDLGVDDEGILRSADLFEPAIVILDNLNIGKTPYSTLDTLVNFHRKIMEIVSQVTDYSSLSDTSLYGLLLYIIQLSNTKNIPSTLNLVHDYIQDEEMSDDEKGIIELLESVLEWASQFEV